MPRNEHRRGLFALIFLAVTVCSRAMAIADQVVPGAGEQAEQLYYAANGLLARGLHELAAAEYRKFLEQHGGHEKSASARYGLAVCLFRLDRKDEAAAELAQLQSLSAFPFAPEVGTMLGQCHLAGQRYAPAVEAFERVVQSNADHALADDAAAGLCEALHRAGRFKEAAERCRSFGDRWNKGPLAARSRFFAGLSAMQDKDFELAIDQFAQVPIADAQGTLVELAAAMLAAARLQQGLARFEAQDFDRAVSAFDQVAANQIAVRDDAAYWAAKCRLRQGNFADAAQRFRAAVEQFPTSELLPACIYDGAFALLQSGNAAGAAAVLEGFAARFADQPLAADALYLLAVARQQWRKYEESSQACRDFLQRYPSHNLTPEVLLLQADNHFVLERWVDAAETYHKFLDHKPDESRALAAKLRLGLAMHRLGRADEAAAILGPVSDAVADVASRRDAIWTLGEIEFQRGEWKVAERSFAAYVSLGVDDPRADGALLKLALATVRQGRFEDAVPIFERLERGFNQSPHRLQATFERGQALVALERYDEAGRAFETVLGEGESRFSAYAQNHLGLIALRRKDTGEAVRHFEQAVGHASGLAIEPDVLVQYGKALMAAERYADAARQWEQFLGAFPNHAQSADARVQHAISLSRQDRAAEALAVIEQIESMGAAAEQTLGTTTRDSLAYERAWCLRRLSRPEAADAFRNALSGTADPALQAHVLLELADLESNADRPEAAREHLLRLRALAASNRELSSSLVEQGLYRLGRCAFQTERFSEAAEVLEAFLEKFPASSLTASAKLICGEACMKVGHNEPAARHLQAVVERFPDDPSCPVALLRLGETLASLQQWEQSETAFRTYLRRFGSGEAWFQAAFGVGWALENRQQFAEAVHAYQDVVARHKGPTAARAQFQIGECLFAQQQYQEAAAELLKVDILYSYPDWSAAALYEAGRCFQKLSKPAEAQAQFRTVVEKFEKTKWAAPAAQALSEFAGG